MEIDSVSSTAAAARTARATLAGLTRGTAIDEPRMAKIAQTAIFEEALLGALHARLNELRSVAK